MRCSAIFRLRVFRWRPSSSAALDRLPSESASTREMNRRSNSRVASGNRTPRWTISSINLRVFRSLVQLEAAEQAERLDIFLARFLDHIVWKASAPAAACSSGSIPGSRARTACRSWAADLRACRYRAARSATSRVSAPRRSRMMSPLFGPSSMRPNSNLVSATMMPRCSACAAPREYSRSVRLRSFSIVSRPTIRPASSSLMLMSCPVAALVAGVKIGSGSRSDSRSPARQPDAADRSGLLIFLPARARQISARDALDRKRLRLSDEHRSALQRVGMRAGGGGEVLDARRAHVVGNDVARFSEPERRQLGEHLPLVGDARAKHVVKGRNAIGRDNQQDARVVRKCVDVANLALRMPSQAVK